MRNKIFILCITSSYFLIIACSSKKETPQSVAQKWCELNGKLHNAPDGGPEYGKAKDALGKFENDMDKKYREDTAFSNQLEKEIEKCEGASEGR